MKKMIIIMLVVFGLICNISTPLMALNSEENEIHIISGDGSFENPYIIEDNDNEIIKFIENNYEQKKTKVIADEYSTFSTRIFTGSTSADTSKSVKDPGSYWYRTNGGGTTAYNGTLVFELIDYTNYNQMGDMCAQALKGGVKSTLKDIAASSYSTQTAKSMLSKLGITSSLIIGGLLPSIGFLASVYGGVSTFSALSTAIDNEILADTQLNKHHLMTVHYKTSYNGSWYLHSTIEESLYKSYPQIPKSAYGTGTYVSSSRIK